MKNELSREELIEQCLELGLPINNSDNIETLKFYLESANDDEEFDLEDFFEEVYEVEKKVKSRFSRLLLKIFRQVKPNLG